jgi:copper chaperone CopZ
MNMMDTHHGCHIEPFEKPLDAEIRSQAEFIYLTISGMGCQTCVTRVRNALLRLDGVLEATIDLPYQVAAVTYDPARVTSVDLVTAISQAGNSRHSYQARFVAQDSSATKAST